jgi:hypothetical protein
MPLVDRVYKSDLPRMRKTLATLRTEFSKLDPTTNWNRLRIEPLARHVASLERLIRSQEFSGESSRLSKGVTMFHSDLVYLRTNVRALQGILEAEKQRLSRRDARKRR